MIEGATVSFLMITLDSAIQLTSSYNNNKSPNAVPVLDVPRDSITFSIPMPILLGTIWVIFCETDSSQFITVTWRAILAPELGCSS
jgi:hypothetical protein